MNRTLELASISVEKQMEEIRHILGAVHRTVTHDELAPDNLDGLIQSLLERGVTRQDIAFLIAEALPA